MGNQQLAHLAKQRQEEDARRKKHDVYTISQKRVHEITIMHHFAVQCDKAIGLAEKYMYWRSLAVLKQEQVPIHVGPFIPVKDVQYIVADYLKEADLDDFEQYLFAWIHANEIAKHPQFVRTVFPRLRYHKNPTIRNWMCIHNLMSVSKSFKDGFRTHPLWQNDGPMRPSSLPYCFRFRCHANGHCVSNRHQLRMDLPEFWNIISIDFL